MTADPRRIVADGYDAVADEYARWVVTDVVDPARARYEEAFSGLLRAGSDVLELGCGGGGPTTARLAERFILTGIDISARQIALARARIPRATFVHADMTRLSHAPSSFDGIAALYSLIHLPYGELPPLLARAATWLRPGGVFVASLGARTNPGEVEPCWLGAPMYSSGYPPEDNIRFVEAAGLEVITAEVETNLEDGRPIAFFWVLARRPAIAGRSSPGPSVT